MTMWRAHGTGNLITSSLEAPPIQRSDLIDGIENSIKAKNNPGNKLKQKFSSCYKTRYRSLVNRKIQTKHKCSGYFREQIARCVTNATDAGSSSRTLCSYPSNLPCCMEIEIRTCQNEAAVKSSSSGET